MGAYDPARQNAAPVAYPEFLRAAESLSCTAWVAWRSGFTEYFNTYGCRYAGFPPSANYGWEWLSLLHPDDAPAARAAWERALGSGDPFDVLGRFCRADGQFLWHRFLAAPVRRDGAIVRWVGVAVELDRSAAADPVASRERLQGHTRRQGATELRQVLAGLEGAGPRPAPV